MPGPDGICVAAAVALRMALVTARYLRVCRMRLVLLKLHNGSVQVSIDLD